MKFIPDDINIDFMGARKKAFIVSGVLVAVSLIAVAVMGLNQGIDFKGGSSLIVAFRADAKIDRGALESSIGKMVTAELGDEGSQVSVQDFDSGTVSRTAGVESERFLVYTEITSLISDKKRQSIVDRLKKEFGDDTHVGVPEEGADVFYLNFADGAEIKSRTDALEKIFSELGYEHVLVKSDYEKNLEINDIEEFNLLAEEQEATPDGTEAPGDDIEARRIAAADRRKQQLVGKKDRRFTVTVEELKGKVEQQLAKDFDESFLVVESSTSVSPSVGRDMLNNGLLAILYAIIGILIYITLRFDFRFAPGAVVALVHDVAITIGVFSIFQVKFSLPIIAALLTIVGYSLNDTIVVMDRVRETFDAYRGRDMQELLNKAINDTLSRTTLTSLTTLFVVIAILVLGGGLIRDFAFALFIGIVVGTYSSIFVASPLVYYMGQYLTRREAEKTRGLRDGSNKAAAAKA